MRDFISKLARCSVLFLIGFGFLTLASFLQQHQFEWISMHHPVFQLVGSAFFHIGAAVVFFVVLDSVFLPKVNIMDMLNGEGLFGCMPHQIRSEAIRGWFLTLAAVIVAFAWAGV